MSKSLSKNINLFCREFSSQAESSEFAVKLVPLTRKQGKNKALSQQCGNPSFSKGELH